jgi:hypothetical protein
MTGWSGLTDAAIDSRVHRRVKNRRRRPKAGKGGRPRAPGIMSSGLFSFEKKVVRTDGPFLCPATSTARAEAECGRADSATWQV